MPGTVLYERDGHVATITYNRPEAMNAINGELRDDLNAAWVELQEDDEAWVAIVTGRRRACSAGAELKGGGTPPSGTFWEVSSLSSLESGMEVNKPVIAAVNGYALGFGLTMLAACDFVIASDRAQCGFPEVQIGVPTIQGAVRMPQRLAWHHAMELLLIGDRIDATRASELGLVWKVVPHDTLMDEARSLAGRLMQGAPLAIRATKEVARRGQNMPFVEAIRCGETMRRVAGAADDAQEGRAAFREKRSAQWQAR